MPASLRRPLIFFGLATLVLAGLIALVVLAPATAAAIDLPAHHWFVAHRIPPLTSVAIALTSTGTSAVVIPVVVVTGLATGAGGRWPRLRHTGFMFAVILSAVLCRTGLSVLIGRARPPAADWATKASGFSFPSGHSADGVLVAGLVCWAILRRIPAHPMARFIVCCLTGAYAVALGLTRAYLGVHWPLDVLGGWTFGCWWLAGAALITAAWTGRPNRPIRAASAVGDRR